jgi:hypothetical protein
MSNKKDGKDLIERYIYDVTRRLSESERNEVRRELEANISDMLSDDPGDQEVSDVLLKLGTPRDLAEQYRQKPRYLISPSMFELYISVLKTVVLIVGIVCFCIGLVTAVFSADIMSAGDIAKSIGSAIAMGIEGVLQAAFWVTIGFVIYERYENEKYGTKGKPWTIDDLPDLPEKTEVNISRSSTIIEMILIVFFLALIILLIVRNEWFILIAGDTNLINPFTQAALERIIPYLIVFAVLGVFIGVLKLIWGRWNIRLCTANIIQNIIWLGLMLYIINWPDLFSKEIIAFTYDTFADDPGVLGFLQAGGIVSAFTAVFIVGALIDIGVSIYKTWASRREMRLSDNY